MYYTTSCAIPDSAKNTYIAENLIAQLANYTTSCAIPDLFYLIKNRQIKCFLTNYTTSCAIPDSLELKIIKYLEYVYLPTTQHPAPFLTRYRSEHCIDGIQSLTNYTTSCAIPDFSSVLIPIIPIKSVLPTTQHPAPFLTHA